MRKSKQLLAAIAVLVMSGFVLASFTSEKRKTAKTQMIADWERARGFTESYLVAANDDVIASKPTPEMRTFGQQMLHLAEGNYGLVSAGTGKQSPVAFGQLEKASERYKTKAALTKAVLDSYDWAIGAIKDMDEGKMSESIKVFNFDITREASIMKAFEHQTHHRGQTTVYLRVNGLTPPEEKLF